MKGLQPAYGFQTKTFEMLKEKLKEFQPLEKRGVIMFDEMKIVPSVALDRTNLKINGLTNLGDYTPTSQTNQPGDHALVFMLQPFTGGWVQPIGAFLSKGAANGQVLSHLLIEAITLSENAGFHIDGVVSDAASWNRAVWTNFQIDMENPSCPHILDPERKLFFFSDFPHLLKNVRNWVQKCKTFPTPDGIVKTLHWEQLVAFDEKRHGKFGIKFCPKLTQNHLRPKHYAKMNVAMAYQYFGIDVAATMKRFSKKKDSPFGADEVKGTYELIYKVNRLIKAMSSRCSKGALYDNECKEYKDISDFLAFLLHWKSDNEKRIQLMDDIIVPLPLPTDSNAESDPDDPNYGTHSDADSDPNDPNDGTDSDADPNDLNDGTDSDADADPNDPNDGTDSDADSDFNNPNDDTEPESNNADTDDDACFNYYQDYADVYDYEDTDDDTDTECSEDEDSAGKCENNDGDSNDKKARKAQAKEAEKSAAQMKKAAKKDIKNQFLTDNTFVGLIVSLKNTLGLHNYLKENYGFEYLMTSRLNQDRLEAFFGMVRSHGGCGSHPTATMFVQIYRLLSVYSLVKSPKGSNVEHSETATTLLHVKNSKKTKKTNTEWLGLLDNLVDKGVDITDIDQTDELFQNLSEALEYFAGYVARRVQKFTGCQQCRDQLIDSSPSSQSEESYQALRDFTNGKGLCVPSRSLLLLCQSVENSIEEEVRTADKKNISQNMVTNIIQRMISTGIVPKYFAEYISSAKY